MLVYIFIYACAVFCSIVALANRYPKIMVDNLLFILILLVVGFRYASVDYFTYLYYYQSIESIKNISLISYPIEVGKTVESGFALFVILEKSIFGNFYNFIFLFSLVSLLIKYIAIKELSPFFLISLLIYLSEVTFLKELGQIRNSMAAGLILYSVKYAYNKDLMRFLLVIFIAFNIHNASIIGLLVYLLRYISNQISMIIILTLSIFTTIFGGIGFILKYAAMYVGFDNSSRIIFYANTKYAEGFAVFGGTFLTHTLLSLIMIFFYQRLVGVWKYSNILVPMFVGGTSLMFFLIDYGIITARIRDMFVVPALVVVMPVFILLYRGYNRIIPYIFIIFYCFLMFYLSMKWVEPYQSILQFL